MFSRLVKSFLIEDTALYTMYEDPNFQDWGFINKPWWGKVLLYPLLALIEAIRDFFFTTFIAIIVAAILMVVNWNFGTPEALEEHTKMLIEFNQRFFGIPINSIGYFIMMTFTWLLIMNILMRFVGTIRGLISIFYYTFIWQK